MKPFPLLAGSAGLAKEVARRLSRSASRLSRPERRTKPFGSIFIVSGSASSVTHQQLKCLRGINIQEFILPQTWVTSSKPIPEIEKDELSKRIAERISGSPSKGTALLRSPEEYITADLAGFPVHRKLREALSSLVLSVLERSQVVPSDLALILTGGDTAMGVIHLLQSEGIEIEEELSEGVMKGYLRGNRWDGLTVVTKAGAFGEKETLRDVVERLEKE